VSKLAIDVEIWPWNSCGELLAYAAKAMETYPYGHVWFCDEFQYEDAITMLTALAVKQDVSLGTMVTFPWRNPLSLAQRFGTISKLMKPGRQLALGLGGGGTVQVQVMGEKTNPFSVIEESTQLLRELLSGQVVELARFPKLAARFRYNTAATTKLFFPPAEPVPIYLAAAGPKMYDLAGRHADGVIFSQLVARTSFLGAKKGLIKEAVDTVEAGRAKGNAERPFKKLFNMHVSVSRDGERARQWGKRNTSYGLAGTYLRYPEVLDRVGLDREEVAYVADAYTSGKGVDEATRRVSDSLLRQAGGVFAGTPEEVIEPMREMKRLLEQLGFDRLIVGVPLGPDVPEALELLGKEVIPALGD
jgi:alkanesulfonate monooxygenase SsuD/methylene tetrahydromethanopterin reductase-like flavin-dependent oxidoreductase (luciferase family)